MKKFLAVWAKTYSYITDNNDDNKKAKDRKKCVVKKKLKFEDYKYCLEAVQLDNKRNYLDKKKLNVHNFHENHKKLIKNKKLILKSQQRFRSKTQCIEDINKIPLSTNNNKKIQSINSTETYEFGTS